MLLCCNTKVYERSGQVCTMAIVLIVVVKQNHMLLAAQQSVFAACVLLHSDDTIFKWALITWHSLAKLKQRKTFYSAIIVVSYILYLQDKKQNFY